MLCRVVGVDPGLTTGLTAFTVNENEISAVESYELDLVGVGNFFAYEQFHHSMVHIGYEVANKFQASGHLSSEVIGVVRYFAMKNKTDLNPVTQSSHKKLITRDVLKKAGLYVKGTHAKDAAGVALFMAVNLKLLRPWFLQPEER